MAPASAGTDAVVVGAGAAGLACAQDLLAAGLRVLVVEASDGCGGRMRTDRVDGFLVDRGFQVFNPAYPQVRRRLDLGPLRLHPFTPGALVHTDRGMLRFSDPSRRPGHLPALLTGRLAGPRDLAALAALCARDALAPARVLRRGADRDTRTELRAAGLSDGLVERFFRPFLSGVFLEDRLETSGRVFHLVWRSMLRGPLCLPAAGIGAVPARLAAALPPGSLRLESPVSRLTGDGVLLADGTALACRAVVVAAGPGEAARLLPGLAVPPLRTVTTYYHQVPAGLLDEPTLVLDERRRFLNTCPLHRVAPECAPAGTGLLATSVLGPDAPGREREVTAALAEVLDADPDGWGTVAVREVPGALPAMPAPHPLTRPARLAPGRYVCGDHRATGSVQGALASGARAAREVLADLGSSG